MAEKDRPVVTFTDTGDVSRVSDMSTGRAVYVAALPDGTRLPRGRPTEKDWQGVLCCLIARASKEGLPTGYGAGAELAKWIHDALEAKNMEAAQSVVARYAHLILAEAEKIQ